MEFNRPPFGSARYEAGVPWPRRPFLVRTSADPIEIRPAPRLQSWADGLTAIECRFGDTSAVLIVSTGSLAVEIARREPGLRLADVGEDGRAAVVEHLFAEEIAALEEGLGAPLEVLSIGQNRPAFGVSIDLAATRSGRRLELRLVLPGVAADAVRRALDALPVAPYDPDALSVRVDVLCGTVDLTAAEVAAVEVGSAILPDRWLEDNRVVVAFDGRPMVAAVAGEMDVAWTADLDDPAFAPDVPDIWQGADLQPATRRLFLRVASVVVPPAALSAAAASRSLALMIDRAEVEFVDAGTPVGRAAVWRRPDTLLLKIRRWSP